MKFTYYQYEKNNKKCVTAVCNSSFGFIKATAVCDPSDNYDEEFGKKLASLKCLKKLKSLDIKDFRSKADTCSNIAISYIDKATNFYLKEADAKAAYNGICSSIDQLVKG